MAVLEAYPQWLYKPRLVELAQQPLLLLGFPQEDQWAVWRPQVVKMAKRPQELLGFRQEDPRAVWQPQEVEMQAIIISVLVLVVQLELRGSYG